MTESDGLDDFADQVDALEANLAQATSVAASFDTELRTIRRSLSATGQDVKTLERGLSRGLRKAFEGLVFDGDSLSETLDRMARTMMNTAYNAALRPVTDHFGGMIANGIGGLVQNILPFEQGGSFVQGRVMPFAKGGVVTGATTFPMRGGIGLMGEA